MSGPAKVGAPGDNLIAVDFQGRRRGPGGSAEAGPSTSTVMPGAWSAPSSTPTEPAAPAEAKTSGAAPSSRPTTPSARPTPPPSRAPGEGTGAGPRRLDAHACARGARGAPDVVASLGARRRPYAWPLVGGLALVAASSLAAAWTVTAPLIEASAAVASQGTGSAFFTTRLLGAALGTMGLQAGFGVGAAMLTVAGLATAGLAAPGSRQAKVGQALTALGLGTMLSPFWLVAASGDLGAAAPGLALASACAVGLQALALRLEQYAALPMLGHVATASVLTAIAPLAAGIALGLGPLHCTLVATTALALGLLSGASLLWMVHLASTDDRSTAALRRTQVPVDRNKRLALPNEPRPTVFFDHPELRRFAQALQARQRAGKTCEGLLLLHGPAGTGKTDTAQAIANLGPWDMYQAPMAALFDAKAPQAVVVPWFEQLRRKAQHTGRTQVAFLDEAELLLRGPNAHDTDDRPLNLAGAFAEMLSEHRLRGSNVLLVVGTNHPHRLAPKVWQLLMGGSLHAVVPFTAPSATQLAAMVTTKLAQAHARYLGLRAVGPYRPTKAFVAEAGEALTKLGAVGRDVAAAVDEALTAANATFGARWRRLEQAQLDAFVERRLRRNWRMANHD